MLLRKMLLVSALLLVPATGCWKSEKDKQAEARQKKVEELRKWQADMKAKREARKNEPPPPNRCAEKQAKELRLAKGEAVLWTKPNPEVVKLPGSVIPERRGKKVEGRAWLPVRSLVPEKETVSAIEVVPCVGEPVRIGWKDIESDPDRYRVTVNRRGVMKLIDQPAAPADAADTAAAEADGEGEGDGEGEDKPAEVSQPAADAPTKKFRRKDVARNLYEIRLVP